MAVAMAADFLRADGWEVVNLGVDLPVVEFVRAAHEALPLSAIAVSVTTSDATAAVTDLTAALRMSGLGPIVLGGAAVTEDLAARCGADAWAADGPGAVAALDRLTV